MARKPVVPPALADALTEDKPRVARVVTALANPDADSVSASPVPSVLDNAPIPAPAEIEALAQKDVETLTDEIIALEKHGVGVFLEIGKRLIAAKDKLTHGEWLPWLERVNITPRYAQRYMRLAREWTNATTLTYLGMSKALALLSLPEDTRETFVAESHVVDGVEMSVNDMSVRELNEAIRAKQDAERRLSELETRLDETLAYNQTLYADLNESVEQRNALNAELDELKRKPIDVAVEKVVDEEAIERAKKAVRDELTGKVKFAESAADLAKANADVTKQSLAKARANLESVINERNAEQERADNAQRDLKSTQSDLDFMTRKYNEANAELERVRADAQKAASLADKDLALFGVLYEQVKTLVNQMSGIMMKRSDEKRESMKNALLSISTQLKEAAES